MLGVQRGAVENTWFCCSKALLRVKWKCGTYSKLLRISRWAAGCVCVQLSFAAAAKLLQSCPTLCDPRDGSPPGSPVPRILQARTLEWGAIAFFSCVWFFATPWTAAHQAHLSMGFSRQEFLSGLPFPPPADLPDPGIEPTFSWVSCIAVRCFTHWATWEVSQAHSVMSDSLRLHGLLCPQDSPGKNTGVGCYFLPQGIFLTQGWNPHFLQLLHCRWIVYFWATGEALTFT